MAKSNLQHPARKRTGRPRTGSLEFRGKTWHARLTVTVDGESVRRWFDLGTDSKPVARRKLARLVARFCTGEVPSVEDVEQAATAGETYAELAERVQKAREADGVRDVARERDREALHVLPVLGAREVATIRPEDLTAIFLELRDAGRAHSTIRHVRHVLNTRLATAWREGIITENPLARAVLPKGKQDRRERAVLSDAELAVYLAWQHPAESHRLAVLERQTMACLSRMFGGLRAGDLHALRWESLETEGGRFGLGWAPRRKTARPQKLVIPEMLRPILRDWWQHAGQPSAGLVFPALRGKRAGEGSKTGVSHASAMRRDLKRAFGLEVPVIRTKREKDGTTKTIVDRWKPAPKRTVTARERELFEETEHTRPVDFHSWRRAFVQALAEAEVNAQQAAALAGHSSLAAHARYLASTAKARELPEAALPVLRILPSNDAPGTSAPDLAESRKLAAGAEHETASFLVGRQGLEPWTYGLKSPAAATSEPFSAECDATGAPLTPPETVGNESGGQNSWPEVERPDGADLAWGLELLRSFDAEQRGATP